MKERLDVLPPLRLLTPLSLGTLRKDLHLQNTTYQQSNQSTEIPLTVSLGSKHLF
jgi:hypothetical protein